MASGDPCYPTSLRLRPAGRWARGPGPARRTRFRPSATRLPGVPGCPDLRQWRPCSYRDPARPGGGPLAGGSASFSEPCLPRQPPRAPERPCTARRRRLRLSTAASSKQASGAACRGSGRVARAAVPSAREPRSRLFSVEKTGNFARLRQASKLLRASRADGTPCHAENGSNCQFRVQEVYHSLFAMASRNDQSAPPRLLAPHGIGG